MHHRVKAVLKHLHHAQTYIFDYVVLISYALYIVALFGLSATAPQYLAHLDYFLKIYASLFLIIRFNPLRSKVPFTRLDKKLVFATAMILLTSTFVNNAVLDGISRWPFAIPEIF